MELSLPERDAVVTLCRLSNFIEDKKDRDDDEDGDDGEDDEDDDEEYTESKCPIRRRPAPLRTSTKFPTGKTAKDSAKRTQELLSYVRDSWNPRGADFLDFVRVLYDAKEQTSLSPELRRKVRGLLQTFKTTTKFVLRKLAAAILPRARVKQEFMQQTLLLPHMPRMEKEWSKDDCMEILEAIVVHVPEKAYIPSDLHIRVVPEPSKWS